MQRTLDSVPRNGDDGATPVATTNPVEAHTLDSTAATPSGAAPSGVASPPSTQPANVALLRTLDSVPRKDNGAPPAVTTNPVEAKPHDTTAAKVQYKKYNEIINFELTTT
jgi:hypothetical protein